MSENGDVKQQGRRRENSDEKELASQQLQIQSKRFYIDVKENQRGRFIKLAEVGVGGRKSRILMTMSVASEFKTRLGEFADLHSSMGPIHGSSSSAAAAASGSNANNDTNNRNRDNDGLIKSETISKDRKRYYLDLKENQRGRFLRVSMTIQNGARSQIAIPAQGLIEFKDQLSDMLERYGSVTEEDNQPELPEGKSLRADNKTFFFDCGLNAYGTFLRITESRQRYRQTIMIPQKFLQQFRNQLTEMIDQISAEAQNGETEVKQAPPASGEKSTTSAAVVKTEVDKSATVA